MNFNIVFKQFLVITIIISCLYDASAQINPKIYMKYTDISKIKERKLLVELIEADQDYLKKLERKKSKEPEKLERYLGMISKYNAFIQTAVSSNWKLNEKFEFKKTSELEIIIEQARKKKSSEFSVLRLAELTDIDYVFERKSDLGVMVLNYGRAEQALRKPDYHIYIPNTSIRIGSRWEEWDIHLAVALLHSHFESMLKKKKVFNFDDFQEESVSENCSELEGKQILIETALLEDQNSTDILNKLDIKEKKEIKIVQSSDVFSSFSKSDKNKTVMICVPYGISKPQSMIPGFGATILITGKLLIDCESKKIINSHEWIKSMMGMGFKKIKPGIQKRNIEGIVKCENK